MYLVQQQKILLRVSGKTNYRHMRNVNGINLLRIYRAKGAIQLNERSKDNRERLRKTSKWLRTYCMERKLALIPM